MNSYEFEIMSGTQYYSMGKTPRQTKFRAKTKDFDKMYWAVGDYFHVDDNHNDPFRSMPYNEKHYIQCHVSGDWNMGGWDYTEVYPHTLQEFTGIMDTNGVEIYEGDIIRLYYGVSYDNDGTLTLSDEYREGIVTFENGAFCFNDEPLCDYAPLPTYGIYVIGNIFDTPEHILSIDYHADRMYDSFTLMGTDEEISVLGAAFIPFAREMAILPMTEFNCGYNFDDNDIYIRFRVHGMSGAFICYMSLDENDDYKYGCNFSGKDGKEMHTWDSNDIKEIINKIVGIIPHNGR